jgi:hypothetical protein
MSDKPNPLQGVKCEVCRLEPAIGVACVPGIPYSAAYGFDCLQRRADPYSILRANVLCLGGEENAASWFLDTMTYVDGEYMMLREALRRHPITEEEMRMDYGDAEKRPDGTTADNSDSTTN